MSKTTIKTTSRADRDSLLILLTSFGYLWHSEKQYKDASKIEADWSFNRYPNVVVTAYGKDHKELAGNSAKFDADFIWPQDAAKIVQKFSPNAKPTSVEIKDVGSYTATVTKDKVQVGCQSIPLTKLQEILDAAKKL